MIKEDDVFHPFFIFVETRGIHYFLDHCFIKRCFAVKQNL